MPQIVIFFSFRIHLIYLKLSEIAGIPSTVFYGYVYICWGCDTWTFRICNIHAWTLFMCVLSFVVQWEIHIMEPPYKAVRPWHCATEKGLRMVPKLKFEHITLTSFSNMRVDLAAQVRKCMNYLVMCVLYLQVHVWDLKNVHVRIQVLSESVSKALELTGGDKASETTRFVEMIDKFLMLLMFTTTLMAFTPARDFKCHTHQEKTCVWRYGMHVHNYK